MPDLRPIETTDWRSDPNRRPAQLGWTRGVLGGMHCTSVFSYEGEVRSDKLHCKKGYRFFRHLCWDVTNKTHPGRENLIILGKEEFG